MVCTQLVCATFVGICWGNFILKLAALSRDDWLFNRLLALLRLCRQFDERDGWAMTFATTARIQ